MAKTAHHQGRGGRPLIYDSYGRLSRVPETGELEKIEDQHADNRKKIERMGGSLGLELDDGLSAWKRGVRRKGFEELLKRVESGESDGCVVWHTDRLFRQPRDLERLIELADKGYVVASAHGTRNLGDPDDRFILRIEVAHAARSSDDTSRRLKRRFAGMRSRGRGQTGGPRRMGFPGMETVGSGPDGGRLPVSDDVVARERATIRDAIEGILSGMSIEHFVREWNAAGLRTVPKGDLWMHKTVRATLLRPSLAGLIEYNGEVVGRIPGEPIVSPEVFERFRALCVSRSSGPPVGLRYVGTGILRCGVCGTKLSAKPDSARTYPDGARKRGYFCNKKRRGCGKVYADMRGVDHEIRGVTLARLSDPRIADKMAAARSRRSKRIAELEALISDIEEIQEALSIRLGKRKMKLDAFDKANEPLSKDHAEATAELDRLIGNSQGQEKSASRAQTVEELDDDWEAADIAGKRAMFTRALGRLWLVVDPAGAVRHCFDRDRVRLTEPFTQPAR